MLVYLAHALGRDPIKRPQNIARVQRWFKFLIDYGPESWALQIPWLVYAQNLDEDTYRARGIRDGQMACKMMDIICLVGGEDTRNSAGAHAERDLFKQLGKGVCDLTHLGPEPPSEHPSFAWSPNAAARDFFSRLVLRHLVR